MGARRKTITLNESPQQRFTTNCSVSARNLRKSDLAGVVFGCKHSTYAECLSKNLFGLPSGHYSYVKNIQPGLPLFLFNYSDRKLHGIFEAVSSGQLSIDPFAWTADGSENTPYAAQVKIRIRMQCQPLLEEQFQPVIADNYYYPKYFWFELDQAQTNKLITMFSSSPITSAFLSRRTERNKSAKFKALNPTKERQECDTGENCASQHGVTNINPAGTERFSLDPYSGRACFSDVRNVNNSDALNPKQTGAYQNLNCDSSSCVDGWSQKKWTDLFKEENCSVTKAAETSNLPALESIDVYSWEQESHCLPYCLQENNEVLKAEADTDDSGKYGEVAILKPNHEVFHSSHVTEPSINLPALDSIDVFSWEEESHSLPHCLEENNEVLEAEADIDDPGKYDEEASLKPNHEVFHSSHVIEPSISCLNSYACETLRIAQERQGGEYFQLAAPELNLYLLDNFQSEWSSSCKSLDLKENNHLEVAKEENAAKLPEDDTFLKSDNYYLEVTKEENTVELPEDNILAESDLSTEIVPIHNQLKGPEVQLTNLSFPEVAMPSKMNSISTDSTIAKLQSAMEEMRLSQSKQALRINSLEQNLVESRLEIQQLKDRYRMLENGFVARDVQKNHLEEKEFQSVDELPKLACDASICLVGGFDSSSWLSALDIYSPSQDLMRTWTSMSFVRSYASAGKFKDHLYILGGVNGNEWYDTVESYDPVNMQWTSHSPLTQKKGSFSVLSAEDKMFVLGGGNGVECFSEVEMFDPDIGRWITIQSLLDKRFAPAAAELNGIIYVAGGYNGINYLKSAERLDPRERSWERLENMVTKRGCHSLAVLNEKLYAIGGFDGSRMVSTVEVFDPRMGSWMMEESMNTSRGYFGSVVIRDEIYVIGGLQGDNDVLDKVECYKDGHGWQVKNSTAIGKRCFVSAVLL